MQDKIYVRKFHTLDWISEDFTFDIPDDGFSVNDIISKLSLKLNNSSRVFNLKKDDHELIVTEIGDYLILMSYTEIKDLPNIQKLLYHDP